jgi:putative hydrolase of the HAD superfamily
MFKTVLFDLDNTLYDYDICHNEAINCVLNKINQITNISISFLEKEFNNIKKNIKINLNNTSASHSRIIYFKNLIDSLDINESNKKQLYDINSLDNLYWTKFFEKMTIYKNIIDLLQLFKQNKIKIGLVTNFTTKIQYEKLIKLEILQYFDKIITSEETNLEKPHEYIFLKIKEELNCEAHEILMIGDSFNDDIYSSIKLNFNCCHLNKTQIDSIIYYKNYIAFKTSINLYTFWKNFFYEIKNFVFYCKRIGERYDLVQAAGGNISFKYLDLLIIKSSGSILSDVNINKGYTILNNKNLQNDLFENNIDLKHYCIMKNNEKPSIETYMHSFLQKYTIHIHPIVFLRYLIKKNIEIEDFKDIVKDDFLLIDYYAPGIDLAKQINKLYNNETVILLKNHGIIITGNNWDQLLNKINTMTYLIELKEKISLKHYRNTNYISLLNLNNITYYCEDETFQLNCNIFKNFFPDKLVYCDEDVFFYIKNKLEYKNQSIIIYENKIYIIAQNLQKCKQIEEILKVNFLITYKNNNTQELTKSQITSILNRNDEKYRKLL